MIVTLTGINSYLLKSDLRQITDAFVKEYTDMGLDRIDGEDVEYDRIREALESLPFLASKKLVVLRTPSANKEFIDKSEKLLSEVPETTDVIIIEPKLDKRSVYFKFLKKSTDYREFNELDEHELSRWLADKAKKLDAQISLSDARYLIERVGVNQQMLSNEIAKLVAHGDNISRSDIDLLTESNPQSTVFQLLDVSFAGNSKQAIKLYHEQRASNVEPQQIIAMLAWQLHVLAIIKTAGDKSDANIASEAKINPYVVRKSRAIANKLSPSKLQNLISDLTELDLKLKSISIDPDDALQAYLLSVAN